MTQSSLSPEARRTLDAVLDELIPPRPDESVPGAGALGVGDFVEAKLGGAAAGIGDALLALDELARSRGADDFASIPPDERADLLREFDPTAPGFIASVMFHGVAGYYQNHEVMRAIGLAPRPPYPEGYALEPGDLGLLDAVRARPKVYREV